MQTAFFHDIARIGVLLFFGSCLVTNNRSAFSQPPADTETVTPVKALLICGGCCHDYDSQKEIIKQGLEKNGHLEVTVVHQGGNGTSAEIELYKDPNWADPYDVILHDECFADDKDPAWLARILKPHLEGKPAVLIHCAMHCYRTGNDDWFEFCGVTSRGHGAHYPHEVRNVNAEHPIMEGFGAAWFNPAGELYRIERLWDSATPLGTAKDRANGEDQVCVWTNDYRGSRVFGTTLGHHNETVDHPTFMRLLTRGTLWAAGKLEDSYLKPIEPEIVPENLAVGKPVTVSSEQRDQNNLSGMINDDNLATRWCASGGDFPQSVELDLESQQPIKGVRVVWESDSASYVYKIEGAGDDKVFRILFDSGPTGTRGAAADHKFTAEKVRFVRLTCSKASPGSWASIRELRVHGEAIRKVEVGAKEKSAETELLGECKLPEGFEATIFASPPAVNYPVFVAAATDGTVFVSSDKNGSLDREPRRGSVVRLVDLDGDGRADQSNLFVDNVDSPRGLVWDHDRLYLMHPPHLSAFIDDDGDGISDRQEILVKNIAFGFEDRPADHTSNGVTLGIDGWLYLAIGDFGFMNAEGTDGRKLQFRGGGVVRVRPDGSGLELYSRGTRNILEVALDPLLRGFARDNTNDGGGWDIRLHHFTGLEDHGYPRRYLNFANEIVAPLADYGGGSGCGGLYMDEPGMPPGFGDCLYTADWGRQQIYRHPLVDRGATVAAEEHEFLGLTRATDLDVDGLSNIYSTSWKGATFTYADENVGFVVLLKPENYQAPDLPDYENASDQFLIEGLKDPSHRRRLETQRTLLRRGESDSKRARQIVKGLRRFASDASLPLKGRVAAVFAIKQILGKGSTELLIELAKDKSIMAWCVRALGDRWDEVDAAAVTTIIQGLGESDPRIKLESIIAAARLGANQPALVEPLAKHVAGLLMNSPDELLRHTAVEGLVLMGADDAVMRTLRTGDPTVNSTADAFRVLQAIHSEDVVEFLVQQLSETKNHHHAFGALCRLAHREGDWKGNSWGTRPDTRGPYYQPETWEQSARIIDAVNSEVDRVDPGDGAAMILSMAANRIDTSTAMQGWIARNQDTSFTWGQLAAADVERLCYLLIDSNSELETESLLQAFTHLKASAKPQRFAELMDRFLNKGGLGQHARKLTPYVNNGDELRIPAAILISLAAIQSSSVSGETSPMVIEALESVWANENLAIELLKDFRSNNFRKAEPIVRRAILDQRVLVAEIGRELAEAWQLADLREWTGPKIEGRERQAVLEEVVALSGDAGRGRQVFAALGCAKCHDVSPTESLRGPYLPNVAKTYRRDQLTEAILMPSKSIAQGFAQNVFITDDGRALAGFVTNEGAEEIVIRDAEGVETRIPVESIEQRFERELSIMPEGLVDKIPVVALSDLVSYLESLK